ncbi:FUSC family protein [Acinetobacter modestus]|uniref:FUSC family protein n=1 Tax=Acinetobacter modestus TaxID=1776740 RepID=UPI001F4AC343|nr:FUSC family protein [Acinetobacter modestus]MCH7329990.1 FUSC family protein [Acinetobacter modestus]
MLLKQLLAFRPSRLDLIFACKTFVAGMLALFISFELDLINPMWSIGTVMIIANPYSGMVSSKCVYRLIGTVAGAVIALLLTPHFINTPWLFTVILSFCVGFALYVSLLDRTPRSYVFMLAGYSTAMIVYNAITYIDTYNIFDIAVARVLEISVGVVSSAVVSATFFPVHVGAMIKQRVNKTLNDLEATFEKLIAVQETPENYTQVLSVITRDASDIHALAVHLAYEKGELKGMTKPLQEMLHQVSLVVANLVALSQRVKQLEHLHLVNLVSNLDMIRQHTLTFLKQEKSLVPADLQTLPIGFEEDFAELISKATSEQEVVLAALKMDVRHFIANILAVKLLWQQIQQGNKEIPIEITAITTKYPSLHRDHGIAIRGGISAVLITFIVTAAWILSGWKAGFMMAQMGAITACILTALDNPVPVLRIFIWGSIVSAGLVFLYAFGIFPYVTHFWQLALVLFPVFLVAVTMMANQMLMPVGMVLGINTMMGLNLHNKYTMDAVSYLDSSFAMVLGVLVSLIVIDLVRAVSPDTSATRILTLHYQAMRQALNLSYGSEFKIHLRSMLDRVGVLNTKMVQNPEVKISIQNALIESSSIIDLVRLQEISQKLPQLVSLKNEVNVLQQQLTEYFQMQEKQLSLNHFPIRIVQQIDLLQRIAAQIEEEQLAQRMLISLNNICESIGHVSTQKMDSETYDLGVLHG